jgi:hypothetical protein
MRGERGCSNYHGLSVGERIYHGELKFVDRYTWVGGIIVWRQIYQRSG